jgi:hypothetical protein
LRDDTGVVEPLPVGLDAGDGRLPRLVRGRLGDVSLGIALGLAISQALEDLDLLCRSCRVLVLYDEMRKMRHIPVKVLALCLDIAHAIARLALALLAVRFFLLGTHGGVLPVEFAGGGSAEVCANMDRTFSPAAGASALAEIFVQLDTTDALRNEHIEHTES